jgi:hypothetical protein
LRCFAYLSVTGAVKQTNKEPILFKIIAAENIRVNNNLIVFGNVGTRYPGLDHGVSMARQPKHQGFREATVLEKS